MHSTRAQGSEVAEVVQFFVLQCQPGEPVHRVAGCDLHSAPLMSQAFLLVDPV